MISHPGTKTLVRLTEKDLSEKKSDKIASHLERCARCRKQHAFLSHIGTVNKPKKNLSHNFKQRVITNLKNVKRSRQPIVATIKKIIGIMMIFRNGDKEGMEGFPGMGLQKGYTLRLIGDSRALIELNDGSSIYLNKDTEITLPSAPYHMSMNTGEIFAMIKPQRERLEIRTPSAVLGVIGTDFDAQITKKNETILKVLKGKVSFKNESGGIILKKKHQIQASKYTKPTPTKMKDTKSTTNWAIPIKPKKKKGGWITKKIIIAFVAVLVLIGALAGVHFLYKEYFSYKPYSYTPLTSDSDNAPARPVGLSPNKGRIVHFPEGRSVGTLRIRNWGLTGWADWEDFGEAAGKVTVPAGKELGLFVYEEATADLSFLTALGPDDLQTLNLTRPNVDDESLKYIKGLTSLRELDCYGTKVTNKGLARLKGLTSLRKLSIANTKITGKGLALLQNLTSLVELNLKNNSIGNEGLAQLKKLPSLKILYLFRTGITDAGLAHLKGLTSLRELWLQDNKISDEGMAHLSGLTSLEKLNLDYTSVGNKGLAYLKGLTSLRELGLYKTLADDEGLSHLAGLSKLEQLILPPATTDKGLVHLKGLTSLRWLDLQNTKATEAGLVHLKRLTSVRLLLLPIGMTNEGLAQLRYFPQLEVLSIQRSPITDEGLKHLRQLTSLKGLTLNSVKVSDDGYKILKELPSLERLYLKDMRRVGEYKNGIGDAGLTHLAGMTSLKILALSGSRVTDAGLSHLKGLTSLENLNLDHTRITDKGLAKLKGLKSLKDLSLGGIETITDAGLVNLVVSLPSLQTLNIQNTGITQDGVSRIKAISPKLRIFWSRKVNKTSRPKGGDPAPLFSIKTTSVQGRIVNFSEDRSLGKLMVHDSEILDLIDKTKVQDPALKEVLQQIEGKLVAIKEYSYVEEVSSMVKMGEMAYREERCFRQPNLFFSKLTQTKHIILDMIGSITYSVVDGKNLWRYVQNAPGSGKLMVERISTKGKFPPAEIQKMIKRHETPKIYKYDLQRMRQAGYPAEDIMVRSGTLLKPFRPCDMATLKLESESAEVWVFTARPSEPMMDTALLRLTINKNDGILRKVEFLGAEGKIFSTRSILNVRLNPGLSKTFFTFSPAPDIEIKDSTEDIIRSLQRQAEDVKRYSGKEKL